MPNGLSRSEEARLAEEDTSDAMEERRRCDTCGDLLEAEQQGFYCCDNCSHVDDCDENAVDLEREQDWADSDFAEVSP